MSLLSTHDPRAGGKPDGGRASRRGGRDGGHGGAGAGRHPGPIIEEAPASASPGGYGAPAHMAHMGGVPAGFGAPAAAAALPIVQPAPGVYDPSTAFAAAGAAPQPLPGFDMPIPGVMNGVLAPGGDMGVQQALPLTDNNPIVELPELDGLGLGGPVDLVRVPGLGWGVGVGSWRAGRGWEGCGRAWAHAAAAPAAALLPGLHCVPTPAMRTQPSTPSPLQDIADMLPPLSPDPHGLLPTASGGDSQEFWNAIMGRSSSPVPVNGPPAHTMVPLDSLTPRQP